MHVLSRLRDWLAANIAAVTYLVFYFFTVVLANLLYATSAGHWLVAASGLSVRALHFDTNFTFGFWALLLMPFAAIPLIVAVTRPILARWLVVPVVSSIPDFRRRDYVMVLCGAYAVVAWSLIRADAFGLSSSATDAVSAVEARFLLQERMHFLEKVMIHAILPFLTFYSIAAASKFGSAFWKSMSVLNVLGTCIALVAINMKWPVLVFLIGVVAGIFVFTKHRPYTKAVVGALGVIAIYLLISTYVFRLIPTDEVRTAKPASTIERTTNLAQTSASFAPTLFAMGVNRMAYPYLYYYNVFTEEGQACGTMIQYFTGSRVCAPTHLIYSRIFPGDGFTNRGTSPAAPHITAYALSGWSGAILAVVGMGVMISAFSAILLSGAAMAGAWVIVGSTVGYHLSQVPGEGAVLYDHGMLWPLLLVTAYAAYHQAHGLIVRRKSD